jgi:ATP-binding protein involved in chromosome partitioning
MGRFACPHCGEESDIFSIGGAERLAKKYGVPLLGSIPLDPQICESGESGKPVILSRPESKPALAFRDVARKVAARVSVLGEGHKAARGAAALK